jgi:isochorismate synthase
MTASIRVTPLGAAFDLLAAYEVPDGAFFEREGSGVATGSLAGALRVGPAPDLRSLAGEVSAVLRGLGTSDRAAPVAIGALPFADDPASLFLPPRAVVRRDDGETWLVDLTDPREDPPPFRPQRVIGDLPHEVFRPKQLNEEPSSEAYARAVAAAVERIGSSDLEKVVLARTVRVHADRDLDARRLLHRLRALEPHCYTFAAPTVGGTLVGASPELLLSRRGDRVRSTPLAGTAPRSGDPDEDRASAEALVGSAKDREEHAIVVDAVADVLGGICDELSFDAEPVLEPTANVWHLATRFEGLLRDPSLTAIDIVAELHPTPAVCGTPEMLARASIAELEVSDRGAYAGPVGWVDARGDGDWAIALRCAALDGQQAILYAGAGIVAGSEPASEVEETDRKFRAFLDSLRWG